MPASPSPTVSGLPAEKLMAAALGGAPVSSPAFAWTPPEAAAVAPWFPDYEVQALIGRGAMGAVYRAVQRKLERPVAIKLLPPEIAAREGAAARFEREARAMAQLQHPNIVALHDYGRTAEGHLFIVMEYVDGADLGRLIHAESGGLSVPHALEIVGQVCDALQYAHGRGFVHRDIKPGNVLVDKDGRVKIADFGLAKSFGIQPSGCDASDSLKAEFRAAHTLTGQAVGTPDYSAPEQLKGAPVDHRADIYSLGVMLYEMLTGDLPRGAWTPPSQRTAAPARLDEVVTRAMQTEPDRRYQQASEVKAAVTTREPAAPVRDSSAVNRVMLCLMFACIIASAFITPTGDGLTMLMLAAPFIALAVYFKMKRRPAGLVAVMIAGMAMGAAILLAVLQLGQSPGRGRAGGPVERSQMETITPAQDGRVAEILVRRDETVVPSTVLAKMDDTRIKGELPLWRDEVLARWTKEMEEEERQLIAMQAELRRIQSAEAEDAAAIKELTMRLDRVEKSSESLGNVGEALKHAPEMESARLELVKAKARSSLHAVQASQVQESLQWHQAKRDACAKSAAALREADIHRDHISSLLPLTPDERRKHQQLLMSLADCELRTVRGGIVLRIGKAPGEFVKAGEEILTVVHPGSVAPASEGSTPPAPGSSR